MKPEPAEGFKHLPPSRHLMRYTSKFGFAALEKANCRKKEARQPLYGTSQRLTKYKKKTRRTQHHEADVRLQAARADQEI
jgi:hypothetical protein